MAALRGTIHRQQSRTESLATLQAVCGICRSLLGTSRVQKAVERPDRPSESLLTSTVSDLLHHLVTGSPVASILEDAVAAQESAAGCGAAWMVALTGLLTSELLSLDRDGVPLAAILAELPEAVALCKQALAAAALSPGDVCQWASEPPTPAPPAVLRLRGGAPSPRRSKANAAADETSHTGGEGSFCRGVKEEDEDEVAWFFEGADEHEDCAAAAAAAAPPGSNSAGAPGVKDPWSHQHHATLPCSFVESLPPEMQAMVRLAGIAAVEPGPCGSSREMSRTPGMRESAPRTTAAVSRAVSGPEDRSPAASAAAAAGRSGAAARGSEATAEGSEGAAGPEAAAEGSEAAAAAAERSEGRSETAAAAAAYPAAAAAAVLSEVASRAAAEGDVLAGLESFESSEDEGEIRGAACCSCPGDSSSGAAVRHLGSAEGQRCLKDEEDDGELAWFSSNGGEKEDDDDEFSWFYSVGGGKEEEDEVRKAGGGISEMNEWQQAERQGPPEQQRQHWPNGGGIGCFFNEGPAAGKALQEGGGAEPGEGRKEAKERSIAGEKAKERSVEGGSCAAGAPMVHSNCLPMELVAMMELAKVPSTAAPCDISGRDPPEAIKERGKEPQHDDTPPVLGPGGIGSSGKASPSSPTSSCPPPPAAAQGPWPPVQNPLESGGSELAALGRGLGLLDSAEGGLVLSATILTGGKGHLVAVQEVVGPPASRSRIVEGLALHVDPRLPVSSQLLGVLRAQGLSPFGNEGSHGSSDRGTRAWTVAVIQGDLEPPVRKARVISRGLSGSGGGLSEDGFRELLVKALQLQGVELVLADGTVAGPLRDRLEQEGVAALGNLGLRRTQQLGELLGCGPGVVLRGGLEPLPPEAVAHASARLSWVQGGRLDTVDDLPVPTAKEKASQGHANLPEALLLVERALHYGGQEQPERLSRGAGCGGGGGGDKSPGVDARPPLPLPVATVLLSSPADALARAAAASAREAAARLRNAMSNPGGNASVLPGRGAAEVLMAAALRDEADAAELSAAALLRDSPTDGSHKASSSSSSAALRRLSSFNTKLRQDSAALRPLLLRAVASSLEALPVIEAQNHGCSYAEAACSVSASSASLRALLKRRRQQQQQETPVPGGRLPLTAWAPEARDLLLGAPPLSSKRLPGAEDLPVFVDCRSLEVGLQQAAAVVRLLLGSDSVIVNTREDDNTSSVPTNNNK